MKKRCPEAFIAINVWSESIANYHKCYDELKKKGYGMTVLEIDKKFLVSPIFWHLHRDNRKYISPPIQDPTIILFESHGLKHPYYR